MANGRILLPTILMKDQFLTKLLASNLSFQATRIRFVINAKRWHGHKQNH